MSPTELKAVFRRILMGAAAPLLLADCGGNGPLGFCHPPPPQLVAASFLPDGGPDCIGACGTEGCVREAFGALVGLHQSAHATARDVRAAMGKIAHDEIAHASFSFDVARHLRSRLDDAARARVDEARETALDALLHQAFASET